MWFIANKDIYLEGERVFTRGNHYCLLSENGDYFIDDEEEKHYVGAEFLAENFLKEVA